MLLMKKYTIKQCNGIQDETNTLFIILYIQEQQREQCNGRIQEYHTRG